MTSPSAASVQTTALHRRMLWTLLQTDPDIRASIDDASRLEAELRGDFAQQPVNLMPWAERLLAMSKDDLGMLLLGSLLRHAFADVDVDVDEQDGDTATSEPCS